MLILLPISIFVKAVISNKYIIRLALPILFAQIIPQISFVANSIFLGKFGELELRVNGVAGIFYLTFAMVGYGLSNGMQIMFSRRAGEGDSRGLAASLSTGLLLSFLCSMGMMMLCLWLAPIIFSFSLHDQQNISSSVNFLYIRVWGLPFLMLTQLLNGFFISIQQSRFLVYGSLAATVVNILFDYLLSYGHAGFPIMGIVGAAVASILAELVQCLVMFSVFFFNRFHHTYPIHKQMSFDVALSKNSLKVASPLIIQYLFSIGGWQIFFFYVEHLGNRELAASQIIRSMFGFIWVGIWAFSAVSNNMVSNIIGQGKSNQVMNLVKKIATLSFVYAFSICLLVFIFSESFIGIYRNDSAIIALAKPAMFLVLGSTIIMSASTVLFNAVVGTGNTIMNLTMEITAIFLYLLYCYFVIEKMKLSLTWAWGSEYVYWISLLVISFFYLRSKKWKGKEV